MMELWMGGCATRQIGSTSEVNEKQSKDVWPVLVLVLVLVPVEAYRWF